MKAPRLAALAWLLIASPALAGGDDGTGPFEPFEAEPIIADCWQRSEELRSSGYIEHYGDGLNITYACMETAVLEQLDAWLLPEFTEHAKTHLDTLEELHGQLYYRIYANNRYCSGFCGLLPSMRYIESYIAFLEKVLRDVAEEKKARYRSRYGPPPHSAGGQEERHEPIDAQALIDACWSETNRRRASGEAGEQESVAYLLECHRSHVLRLTDHMFDPELLSRRDVHRILAKLHHNIGKFYVYLFHEHNGCGCDGDGDVDVTYDLAMVKALQRILHHFAYQYNRYRF